VVGQWHSRSISTPGAVIFREQPDASHQRVMVSRAVRITAMSQRTIFEPSEVGKGGKPFMGAS
jgi:hypothetical protein